MCPKSFSGPLALIILDGWGHRDNKKDNGIELARKPFFDSLIAHYPNTLIDGSGPAVGLPKGIMGNSEVGHMNLGAGRIVYSGLSQIYSAIENGGFFKNAALLQALTQAKKNHSTLHLMGLVSDGAVHSHQDHLYALLQMAKDAGVQDVAVHAFLDGRDTSPRDGIKYIALLEDKMRAIGVGRIASMSGRYYAMDRDQRWDRVEKAFAAICGKSSTHITDVKDYLKNSYTQNVSDEFTVPASIVDVSGKTTPVKANDAFVFFNFRADRARQISHAFVDAVFADFDRQGQALPAKFVCMAPYDSSLKSPIAFTPTYPEKTLPEILATHHIPQLRIAETEKYAHVTFFFNGGRDIVYDGEDRVLIPSPKDVATYDKKPEMSALLVKDELIKRLQTQHYGVVVCNFANTDMVGHTAIPAAIFKAVETVDTCLAAVVPEILKVDGVVLITADHGNAEQMVDDKGQPLTSHTTNLVPLILVGNIFRDSKSKLTDGGRLCDVAPTMLKLLELEPPTEMTGVSLWR